MGIFDFLPGEPTYEAVERRRALANALGMQAVGAQPATFGQGLSAIGAALGGALANRGAERMDTRRAAIGDAAFEAALNGMPQDNSPLAAALGGNYATPVSTSTLAPTGDPLRDGILETAQAIGADPVDLATAISYETAGTFDPTKAGPTTQWGQHRGLIQFGEPQARQYGVDWNDPIGSQLGANGAIANYFRDRGFKPGMSGLDLYSTINAGSPGRYSASDANNGGAPGTVADKWSEQMAPHREKAMSLLGGSTAAAAPGLAPMSLPAPPPVNVALIRAMNNPYMTPEQKQILGGIYQQQLAMQITPYQQAQLQMAQQEHALRMQQAMQPEPVRGSVIGQRLVNPQTGEVMADFTAETQAGFRQATPEEAAAYGAAGGQFGPDGRFYPINPPSGFAVEIGPDGQTRVVQGAGAAGAAGKPFTEGQSKDNVFATRAEGALQALEPVANALTSRTERMAEGIPLGLARGMQSDDFQLAHQAGREFMMAILRKDTGAAITASEETAYGQVYLPQPGDNEAVLAQKQEARRRALEGLKAGMSPAQLLAQGQALIASGSQPIDTLPASPSPSQSEGWQDLGNGIKIRRKE